ncbi:sensor histidine kinase [Corynebacterium sp. H78]|uniref:sensor histidine kinase n=1 Tax=Corynebacterium sp. H78 TaxID=3133417 RepID=UPI0030B1038C
MNDPQALTKLWRNLRFALDLLIAVLLCFALVRSLSVSTALWGIGFIVVYAAGIIASAKKQETLIWLLLLLVMWAGLASASQDAAYLAFPLFFVIMHTINGWVALLAVVATTIIAITAIAHHLGLSVGGIVGPMLGAIVAVIVGSGFRMLQREAEARAHAIDELMAARADIATMARHAGVLDERTRLAADIHDTIAQGLTSIQLLLYSVEKQLADDSSLSTNTTDELQEKIQLARQTAADNLAETRRIINELQPAELDGVSLNNALKTVCAGTPMGEAVKFVSDGQPLALPPNVETVLIRVAQSSIANVVQHSGATSCTVNLTYKNDEVRLDIVDNGTTFNQAAVEESTGVGVSGARRRLESIGGHYSIAEQPGGGCGVSARIPV